MKIKPLPAGFVVLSAAGMQGCAGATLLGQGFRVRVLADLVAMGSPTAHRETMRVDKCKVTIARISDAEPAAAMLEAHLVMSRSAWRGGTLWRAWASRRVAECLKVRSEAQRRDRFARSGGRSNLPDVTHPAFSRGQPICSHPARIL
jgi:hypothetical protein